MCIQTQSLYISTENFLHKESSVTWRQNKVKALPVLEAAIKSIKTPHLLLSRNLQPNCRPVHTRCRLYKSHLTRSSHWRCHHFLLFLPHSSLLVPQFLPFSLPPNPSLSNPSSQFPNMLISAEVDSLSLLTLSYEPLRCVLIYRAFAAKNFTFRFLSSLYLLSASS